VSTSCFCLSVQWPGKTSSPASFVVHDAATTRRKRNGTPRRRDKLVAIVARWRRERFVRGAPTTTSSLRRPLGPARPRAVFLYRGRSFFTGHCSRLPPSVVGTRFIHLPTVRYLSSTEKLTLCLRIVSTRFLLHDFRAAETISLRMITH